MYDVATYTYNSILLCIPAHICVLSDGFICIATDILTKCKGTYVRMFGGKKLNVTLAAF